MVDRIEQLSAPPIPGHRYLVPCVRGMWYDTIKDWPVTGPQHNDPEFFHFQEQHYHLDRRFLPRRAALDAISAPMVINAWKNTSGFPPPVWRVRLCRSAEVKFPDNQRSINMQAALAGTQCKRAKSGWVCPHRHFPLGSVKPNEHGRIMCPLHGLQIDAETGIVPEEQIETGYSVNRYNSERWGIG